MLGFLGRFGILNTNITPNGSVILSGSLTMMAGQIDITINKVRKKSFWFTQTLFYLSLGIFLILELAISELTIPHFLVDLLLILVVLFAVNKTRYIEKRKST